MQFTLFHPLASTEPVAKDALTKFDWAQGQDVPNAPTFLRPDAARGMRIYKAGPHMRVQFSIPKPTKKLVRMKLRISFVTEMRSHFWGLKLDVALPRAGGEPVLDKSGVAGNPDKLPKDVFNNLMSVLTKGIEALMDPAGGARDFIPEDVQTPSMCEALTDLTLDLAHSARKDAIRSSRNAKATEDKHAETFNMVPNGTPLIIRRNMSDRHFQLGVKRGDLPKAIVANCRLATPEEIISKDLQEVGLSRHQALHLNAAASRAVAIHPDLVRFKKISRYYQKSMTIDKGQPFHDSFRDPDEIKRLRKESPTIWLQSRERYRYKRYALNKTDRVHYRNLMDGKTINANPSFPVPGKKPPKVLSFSQMKGSDGPSDLRDLEMVCGIWTVSEPMADLLRSFEMGSNILEPVLFVDSDDRHMANRYMLVINEYHASIMAARCPANISSLLDASIKDYDIPVDPSQHGNIDLWADRFFNPRSIPLLFSDRLMKAIKREDLSAEITVRRCDTT